MNYIWNDNKNQDNIVKHTVSLDAIYGFEWGEAVIYDDLRKDYGERRQIAKGPIGNRLYVCIFTDQKIRAALLACAKQIDVKLNNI